jgi:glycosyltransferase involved in cell wall biosynthesis
MKVLHVCRKQHAAYFSIEKVFSTVTPWLEKKLTLKKFNAPRYTSGLKDVFANIRAMMPLRADVYHVTGDIHYAVLGLPSKYTILTIHDAVFMHKNKGLKRTIFHWLYLKLPVKRAALVTTISEKSKQEIISFTGCNPNKITVVPNPVEQRIYYSEKPFNKSCPVILFIGTTDNKNLFRSVEALEGIRCTFHIIGKLSPRHSSWLEKKNIRYKVSYQLSDQELADCYAESDVVLFPSTYEGFGLPIIEGQKAGRAVITSTISPLKEVSGGGACLIDPYDTASIRQAIKKIIQDDQYRNELVMRGFENVQKYTPEAIGQLYLDLYKRVAAEHSA